MAVTVDNQAEHGFIMFDSADASGGEEILAAVTGKKYGITGFAYTCAVAGQSTLDFGGQAFILQLPANGGISAFNLPKPIYGDDAAAVNVTSPAGAASGMLFYTVD